MPAHGAAGAGEAAAAYVGGSYFFATGCTEIATASL